MDLTKFLEQDKNENKSNSGNRSGGNNQYLNLSKKDNLGHTFIYKPLLDVNGSPYRRIRNPFELHIQVPDESGNTKWRVYGILGDKRDYGRLTESEDKLYEEAKSLMTQIADWGAESAWASTRKVVVMFYAYALKLINTNGQDKLEKKGFTIVTHTSGNFLDSFHKVRQNKSNVFGTQAWINDYFDIEQPSRNIIVTTNKAEKSFGFDVTVDFMERAPEVSIDELKKAAENVGDLNKMSVRASFDEQYFKEIITVCKNWINIQNNTKTTQPISSPTDQLQTEAAAPSNGPTGTPVTPTNQSTTPPPPPPSDTQMKV